MSDPVRPDETGMALLQSRHVLNEHENSELHLLQWEMERKGAPVHYYAWGLFKSTLLKVMKDRQDLKDWSPEVFVGDQDCHHCNRKGKTPVPQDSPAYREHLADHLRTEELIASGQFERTSLDTPFNDGDPLYFHCTPCQGSGILTKLDLKLEELRNK